MNYHNTSIYHVLKNHTYIIKLNSFDQSVINTDFIGIFFLFFWIFFCIIINTVNFYISIRLYCVLKYIFKNVINDGRAL